MKGGTWACALSDFTMRLHYFVRLIPVFLCAPWNYFKLKYHATEFSTCVPTKEVPPGNAVRETMAKHRLGSNVEELEWSTRTGNHEMCMVSNHPWNNSYEVASSPYQHGTNRYLATMSIKWYTRAPSTILWCRKNDMGIFKNPKCKAVKDDSEPGTRRLNNTSSTSHMASQETSNNTIDTSERNLIPTSTTNEPDSARHMEFLQRSRWKLTSQKRERNCRKLPHGPGSWGKNHLQWWWTSTLI